MYRSQTETEHARLRRSNIEIKNKINIHRSNEKIFLKMQERCRSYKIAIW